MERHRRLADVGITKRESEVLDRLLREEPNATIAGHLRISERTVESHVSSLLRKFRVGSRGELAEALASAGLAKGPAGGTARPRPVRFVGRASELRELLDELGGVRRSGMRVVLLSGEPGVGKSRLIHELVGRSRHDTRTTVLSARAFPLGSTTMMAPWSDALDSHLRQLEPGRLTSLCGPWLDDVLTLVPRLREVLQTRPAVGKSQGQTYAALGGVLRRLAAAAPVLVTLDDAHLADSTSWSALERLAFDLADHPVLVVVAARPSELMDHMLAGEVLDRLGESGVLRRLPVLPLDATDVQQLACEVLDRAAIGDRLVDWLMARSQGNPLYAISLVGALVDAGADLDSPSLRAVPDGLGDRVKNRMRRLDRRSETLLELLAAFGRPTTVADIVAAGGGTVHELVGPIEALVESGLVVEPDTPYHDLLYDIAHPMIAQVVYQATSGVRRRVIHRRIARHLREAGRSAEASSHLARAALLGDDEAVDELQEALAEAGRVGAHKDAHAILGAFADVLAPDDPRWLSVFLALSGEAQAILDHRADIDAEPCIRALLAMDAQLAEGQDLQRRGIVQLRLSSLYSYGLGDVENATSAARKALLMFEASGDTERALLARVELVSHQGVVGDTRALKVAAAELLADAEQLTDPLVLMHVTGWLGLGCSFSGDFGRADELLKRSAQIAGETGERFHETWSKSVHTTSLAIAGSLDDALALVESTAQDGAHVGESIYYEGASIVHWAAGQFADAVGDVESILRRHNGQLGKRRGYALPFGAMAAAEMGDTCSAHDYLRQAENLYRDRNFMIHRDFAAWARAVSGGLEGDLSEALTLTGQASGRLLEAHCLAWAGPVLLDRVELAASARDDAVAASVADTLKASADSLPGNAFHHALADLALAFATPAGDASASAAAARAAGVFESRGYLPYAARAHGRLGETRAAAGDVAGARADYSRAVELFDRCGALVRRTRVLGRLARLGQPVPRVGRRSAEPAVSATVSDRLDTTC